VPIKLGNQLLKPAKSTSTDTLRVNFTRPEVELIATISGEEEILESSGKYAFRKGAGKIIHEIVMEIFKQLSEKQKVSLELVEEEEVKPEKPKTKTP